MLLALPDYALALPGDVGNDQVHDFGGIYP
jgi:hypothetical protein